MRAICSAAISVFVRFPSPAELNRRRDQINAQRNADRAARRNRRLEVVAQTLNAENVAAERPAPPPPNSAAWDAHMLDLCSQRQAIDDEAARYKAVISEQRKALKAAVINAQSTMGAFDLLYDLWQVREAAEESGDDSVLVARAEAAKSAWRVLQLGTQPEFGGFDQEKKTKAATAHDERMASAKSCGFEAGCRPGAKLADAYAAWTESGTRSRSETRAFEEAFADGVQRTGQADAPSDKGRPAPGGWQREKGKRGPLSKAEKDAKATFEAGGPRMESVGAAPSASPAAAYSYGYQQHQSGVDRETCRAATRIRFPQTLDQRQSDAGWLDSEAAKPHVPATESALDRHCRIQDELASLPDGGDPEALHDPVNDDDALQAEPDERLLGALAGTA
jgi:hypothetical protein